MIALLPKTYVLWISRIGSSLKSQKRFPSRLFQHKFILKDKMPHIYQTFKPCAVLPPREMS